MEYLILGLLGLSWGSFANVCIYRLPKDKKGFILGRSFCPSCKKKIKWFDNIPLISFLLLSAKCRFCKKKISSQYFYVEAFTAFLFIIFFYFFGISFTTLFLIILSVFAIIIFFIDFKHFIIPNELTFSLMFLSLLKLLDSNLNLVIFSNFQDSMIGGIAGYLLVFFIVQFYRKVRKKEGMGMGDAKLLSAIGFWFGWYSIPFIMFISSAIALVTVVPSLIQKSKKFDSIIPFGPFIILGTVLFLVISNYTNLIK